MADKDYQKLAEKVITAIMSQVELKIGTAIRKASYSTHKRGKVLSLDGTTYTIEIDGKKYSRISALTSAGELAVGAIVALAVPNGDMSQIFILGELTN